MIVEATISAAIQLMIKSAPDNQEKEVAVKYFSDNLAKIIADSKAKDVDYVNRLQVELQFKEKEDIATCDKKLNDQKVESDATKQVAYIQLEATQKQLTVATKTIQEFEQKDSSTKLYFYTGGGIVAGVVATVATFFIVEKL